MKRIILAGLVGLLLGVTAATAGTISFALPLGPIAAGSSFDVPVLLSNVFAGTSPGDELLGFGFNVGVGNAGVLQFLGATVPLPFNDLTGAFAGTAVAGDVFPGLTSVAEPILLATLRFRALAAGSSTIAITSNLADPNQGLIFLGESLALSGQTSVTAVPEPATVMSMAAGLALLVIRRRATRRKCDLAAVGRLPSYSRRPTA